VAAAYRKFTDALAGTLTVHTIERCRRERSSPQGLDYCIMSERQDICALQTKTQSRLRFGHSYGGLIALEAARSNSFVERVAVYEPGVSVNGSMPITWADEYARLLAANKRLDAFVAFSAAVGPKRAKTTPRWLMKLLMPVMLGRQDLRQKLNLLESNLGEHEQIAILDNTYSNYAEVPAQMLVCSGARPTSPG
jgi:pimeloyl-ACP methyl ester carboxylesterase